MMRQPTAELVEQLVCEAIERDDVAELDRLARLLDELTRPKRGAVALVSAALWYAEHGLHVFPLRSMSKEPWPKSHGCLDATTDADQIRRWWAAAPSSNIGIATGHVVDVIDIDGLRGNVSLARMLCSCEHEGNDCVCSDAVIAQERQALSHVIGAVSTPRAGGRHLYVPATGRGNGAKLADGIDYRGLGGYVVAPPSATETGLYRWTRALDVDAARRQAVTS
jgi:hypothetical protein